MGGMVPCPAGKKNGTAADRDGNADKSDGSGIFGEEKPAEEKRDDGSKGVERAEDGEVCATEGGNHGEIADGVESAADEDVAPEVGGELRRAQEGEQCCWPEHEGVGEDPGVIHPGSIEQQALLNRAGGDAQDYSE